MTVLGSAPHHDRVLIVVLVMTDGSTEALPVDGLTRSKSRHAEAFWQGVRHELLGPEGTPEAPADDECVQKACPKCDGRGWTDSGGGRLACEKCAVTPEPVHGPPMPAASAFNESRPIGNPLDYTDRPGCGRCAEWVDSRHTLPCAGCPNTRHARERRERERTDLIERLGPLPEPIPEEGP